MLLVIGFSYTAARSEPPPMDTLNFPANTGQPAPPANQINTVPVGTFQNNPVQTPTAPPTSVPATTDMLYTGIAWKGDTIFVMKAGDGGLLEVKLGKLALTHASSQKVKELGQLIASDHGKANLELKTLAQKKGIYLSTKLSKKSQMEYDKLAKLKGSDFDKAYTKMMVEDHKKNIQLFKDELSFGKDAQIQTWASDKIPTLQHHLKVAEEAEKTVDKTDTVQ